jgi:nucleoid DNA-binding protein
MTKSELIDALSKRFPQLAKKDVDVSVAAIVEVVVDRWTNGDSGLLELLC